MNEQELIRRIQEETEATPIPDRLSPEHVAEDLSHSSKKKKWYQHPWINMAAALLLIGIISTTVWSINRSSSWMNRADTSKNENASLIEESAMEEANEDIPLDADARAEEQGHPEKSKIQTVSDYSQLYQLLSDLAVPITDFCDDEILEAVTQPTVQGTTNAGDNKNTEQSRSDSSFYETNSQVNNVAEADIVKTDGNYIYSCCRRNGSYNPVAVAIARAKNGKLQSCGMITLESIFDEIFDSSDMKQRQITEDYCIEELYIVDKKLILLCEVRHPADDQRNTYILTYDIRSPENPKLLTSLVQEGAYKSSRLTKGCLYTFSEKCSNIISEKYEDYDNYIPHINQESLTCDCIYLPECPDASCFQIMTGMKLSESERFVSSKAILSGNGIYYVSEENIYFAQEKWNCGSTQTELLKFSYEEGKLEPEGSITIDGYLLNQFSMDEYNGYLRTAVTLSPVYSSPVYSETDSVQISTNALYIIDSDMNLVGTIDDLAPDERIYSVRFMGDTGYFVTYRETDPLFSVDLSDPSNPQVMDALKIPGFSNYLHFYSDNLLLGLGEENNPNTGDFMGLKLSMFDISDPYDIREIDKTVLPEAYYAPAQYNHKAFLIDPERNLMGFYIECYDKEKYEHSENYVIYSYIPGSGFVQQFSCNITDDSPYTEFIRGIYIGDYLYLVNGNCICSYAFDTYQKIDEIRIETDGAGN